MMPTIFSESGKVRLFTLWWDKGNVKNTTYILLTLLHKRDGCEIQLQLWHTENETRFCWLLTATLSNLFTRTNNNGLKVFFSTTIYSLHTLLFIRNVKTFKWKSKWCPDLSGPAVRPIFYPKSATNVRRNSHISQPERPVSCNTLSMCWRSHILVKLSPLKISTHLGNQSAI